jgi:Glycosyltransferase family 87
VGRRELTVAVVAASAVFLAACTVRGGLLDDRPSGDLNTYELYAERMLDGDIPYRDFFVEYPPGALPVFVLPELAADDYRLAFGLLMALCGVVAIAAMAVALARVGASRRRLALALGFFAVFPAALGPVTLQRFDLWPAALTAAAVAALVSCRLDLGASLLGVGAAVKVFPAVLLPLRASRRVLAVFASALVAVCAAFVLLGPTGLGHSMWLQARRGLQIESLGASILLALGQLGLYEPTVVTGKPGSRDLAGPAADIVGVASTALQLVAIAAALVLARRATLRGDRFLLACAAAMAAVVAFGKVLSPQFLVWLVPLVPLVAGATGVIACLLLGLALVLTQLWFVDALTPFDLDGDVWLVLARNLLLVAVYAVLLAATARRRAPTRTTEPPSGRPSA